MYSIEQRFSNGHTEISSLIAGTAPLIVRQERAIPHQVTKSDTLVPLVSLPSRPKKLNAADGGSYPTASSVFGVTLPQAFLGLEVVWLGDFFKSLVRLLA